MAGKCLFEYSPQSLEANVDILSNTLGAENVFNWGNGQIGIHCPTDGCTAEMERASDETVADYTLSSVQVARAKCLKRSKDGQRS